MRYKANARVVSAGGKEIGRVSYTVKAKNKSGALAKLRQMFKANKPKPNRKKNIEQGYWVQVGRRRVFHPIRATGDYSPSRAGESKVAAKKARKSRTSIS